MDGVCFLGQTTLKAITFKILRHIYIPQKLFGHGEVGSFFTIPSAIFLNKLFNAGSTIIRVNGFSPGVIPTEMTETAIQKRKVELIHAISMQRLGKIQEVANAVLFLASQSSSYITGIDLEISGGKFLLQDPQTPWQESKR